MNSHPLTENPTAPDDGDAPLSSSAVRLSPRAWLVAAVAVGLLWVGVPAAWQRIEPLPEGPDLRVPYALSEDYWMIERHFRQAVSREQTLLIGDSVVWGHYVNRSGTLSHYLNELTGEDRFANLGVDGIHPAALGGLVEHYGRAVRERKVLLNCNLLWTSSARHDLQTEKEFSFNHAMLSPQFWPRIPCYKEPLAGRLGAVVGRNVSMLAWGKHLQIAYFDNNDLPYWTIEHPYQWPIQAITLELPSPDEPPSPEPVAKPWTEQGIGRFNPDWVELNTSIQWSSFRRLVRLLQRRRNEVFVVVGPFNEHMLGDESREVYQARKRQVEVWLRDNGIPCYAPPPLASRLYADASHPLAEGYRTLVVEMLDDESFQTFLQAPL